MTADRLNEEMTELFITGNGTVWFLMTLFLAEVLFFVFLGFSKYKTFILVTSAIMLEISVFFLNDCFVNPFWTVLSRAFAAYGLVVLGYYIKHVLDLNDKVKLILGFALLLIWVLLLVYAPYNYEFFQGKFKCIETSIPTIISGCTGLILLFSCIKKKIPILEYIGKDSLLYMLCHPLFIKIYIFIGIAYLTSTSSMMQILLSIIVLLLVFIGATAYGELIKRYIPFVIGRKHNN